MKESSYTADNKKVISIMLLFLLAILIAAAGLTLILLSFLHDTYFQVLGNSIHGSVFGLVILFLGVRYLLSVNKLKKDVYKDSSRFSWSNFKALKPSNPFSKNR